MLAPVHTHWSLQRSTHEDGRLLSPRETMSVSARVSALASLLAGVISFLLLTIMAVWSVEIV